MRKSSSIVAAAAAVLAVFSAPSDAAADVKIRIDKSTHTMNVWVDGELRHTWPVSTGRGGYSTPSGSFRPQSMAARHMSSIYRGASMNNAIFFKSGYAIHATTHVGNLGRPASHGCVRLDPSHARELYGLVQSEGTRNTSISIR